MKMLRRGAGLAGLAVLLIPKIIGDRWGNIYLIPKPEMGSIPTFGEGPARNEMCQHAAGSAGTEEPDRHLPL